MAYSTKVITDILHAAGAQDVLTIQRFAHLIGGARMGTAPDDSVVDADQRIWAVPNLFLADGSVCPTQGAANPALTIMALASRLGARMTEGAGGDMTTDRAEADASAIFLPHVLREYALLADGERGALVGPRGRHRLDVRAAVGLRRACSPR